MQTLNQFVTPNFKPSHFERTEDGFLRVTARVLAERVMPYAAHELGQLPEEQSTLQVVNMFVSRETMATGDALRTLEGAQVVAPDHIWVVPENSGEVSKGHAAGAARIDGPYAVIDLVITDPSTITAIEAGEIGEISAGYHAESIFENGDFDGTPYQARQCQLRFNHIAIIPFGEGRAGSDVRIINKKTQEEPRMVRVKLANTGKFINVEEGDVAALEAEQTASDQKVAEAGASADAGSGKKIEDLMKQVEELNAQIAELTTTSEEAKGELSVYKEKLDQLLSDEAQEAQAVEMAEESGEADEIIENACAGMDEKKASEIKNGFTRIGNTSLHKLRGVALKTQVLNAIGMKTEGMAPAEINGAFKAHHSMAVTNRGNRTEKTVAGKQIFERRQVANSAKDAVSKMWGKKSA